MLDRISQALVDQDPPTQRRRLFSVVTEEVYRCRSCGWRLVANDTLPCIPLAFGMDRWTMNEHPPSVADLLHAFLEPELIPDSAACERCGRRAGVERTTSIKSLPRVIFMCVKRYDRPPHVNRTRVLLTPYLLPHRDVALSPEMPEKPEPEKHYKTLYRYRLAGVVCHSGSHVHGGHYTAYVTSKDGSIRKGVSTLFDDAHVSTVPSIVSECNTNDHIRRNAYVIAYELVSRRG